MFVDNRLGGTTRYYLDPPKDWNMQIPDQVRKCIVFLGYDSPADGEVLAGTAFYLGVEDAGVGFLYLVTAAHIIEGIKEKKLRSMFARINAKAGGTVRVEIDVDRWIFHPNDPHVDVAVTGGPQLGELDAKALPGTMAATSDVLPVEEIGLGDEVCMVGLYTKHAGKGRNVPIVRIGNIAAMREEFCETKRGPMDAYLVEIRSIGGISGSPVFVRPPLFLTMETPIKPDTTFEIKSRLFLLGLMHGRWDVKHLAPIMFEIDSDYLKQPLNSGIAVVVPIEKILETIDHPLFVESRQRFLAAKRELDVTSTDAANGIAT